MGSSGSKVAQKTARKFPSRPPGTMPAAGWPSPARGHNPQSPASPTAPQQQAGQPQASYTKNEAILADSVDPSSPDYVSPEFAERLRKMGIVQPNPTYSPSSIASPVMDASGIAQTLSAPQYPSSRANITLNVLEARRKLEAEAQAELDNLGKLTNKGRQFLDITTIKQALVLRDRGVATSDIESQLGLRPGVVAKLGPKGLVSPAS